MSSMHWSRTRIRALPLRHRPQAAAAGELADRASSAEASSDSARVSIADASGRIVFQNSAIRRAGLNRMVAGFGGGRGGGPAAALTPGDYTVTLDVAGQKLSKLAVVKARPRAAGLPGANPARTLCSSSTTRSGIEQTAASITRRHLRFSAATLFLPASRTLAAGANSRSAPAADAPPKSSATGRPTRRVGKYVR